MKKIAMDTEIVCDLCGKKLVESRFIRNLDSDAEMRKPHIEHEENFRPDKLTVITAFDENRKKTQMINVTPVYEKEFCYGGLGYQKPNVKIEDLCPSCKRRLLLASINAITYQEFIPEILDSKYNYLDKYDRTELLDIYLYAQASKEVNSFITDVQDKINIYFEEVINTHIKTQLKAKFSESFNLDSAEEIEDFCSGFGAEMFHLTDNNKQVLVAILTKIKTLLETEKTEDFKLIKSEEALLSRMRKNGAEDNNIYSSYRVIFNILKFYNITPISGDDVKKDN